MRKKSFEVLIASFVLLLLLSALAVAFFQHGCRREPRQRQVLEYRARLSDFSVPELWAERRRFFWDDWQSMEITNQIFLHQLEAIERERSRE